MPGSDSDSGGSAVSDGDWYLPSDGDDSSSGGSEHSQNESPSVSEGEDGVPDAYDAPVDRWRATGGASSNVQLCQGGFVVSCQHCLALCLAAQHRNLPKPGEMRVYALHATRPKAHKAIVLEADRL